MNTKITLERGDITKVDVDGIVNAANCSLLGGSGVDGAIHRAAGPELLEACRKFPPIQGDFRVGFGEARITPGFELPARFVIHTVGPIYGLDPSPQETLRKAYQSSFRLAVESRIRTLALPGISTGVYGFPLEPAARIAFSVAKEGWDLDEIRFVMFDEKVFEIFSEVAEKMSIPLR